MGRMLLLDFVRHEFPIARAIRGLGEISALSGRVKRDNPVGDASLLSGDLSSLTIDDDSLNFAIVMRDAAHLSLVSLGLDLRDQGSWRQIVDGRK